MTLNDHFFMLLYFFVLYFVYDSYNK